MQKLTLKTKPLPAELRQLCGRVANERSKAATWAEARRLRQFAQQRMAEGESVVQVSSWLAAELTKAVEAQRSR